ncbi:MAG: flagellar filament capping protein FliD [Clostridiales bacterium]|nr:flagellar filament capping protein FliD [Clostridiales bacterium]
MSNPIRIGGLASGMDIDLIVSDLMKAERIRVDKLYQNKQTLQWQQEFYREINTRLLSFRNSVFDMRLQATLKRNTAIVSDESILAATAGSTVQEGTYTLKVNALARQAVKESETPLSRPIKGSSLSVPVTIDSANNEFKITLDGVEKAVVLDSKVYDGTAGNTLEDLKNDLQAKIDDAFGTNTYGEHLLSVGLEGDRLTFQPGGDYKPRIVLNSGENDVLTLLGFNDGDSFKINTTDALKTISNAFNNDPFALGDTIEFRINGQTFSYDFGEGGADENKTLAGIISDINANTAAGVEVRYDSITDRIVIKSKEYGPGARVQIENISGNLFGADGAIQIDNGVHYGSGSEIVLNGVTITNSSNKFTLEGISFTLMKESSQGVEINVQKDTGSTFDVIKGFVEEYNSLIELINGRLTEERFRVYPPLTEEQKKAMSERDIELWEEKAKSGLLRSDPMLRSIAANLRSIMYSPVEGLDSHTNMLAAIGIGTTHWTDMGKLSINEDRLKEALNNNLEGVVSLFTGKAGETGVKGIAVQLYEAANDAMGRVTAKAGSPTSLTSYDKSYMGTRIREVDNRIASMEEYLLQLEDRYWKQFIAMEKALDQMNSQSMWLSQQLMFWGN